VEVTGRAVAADLRGRGLPDAQDRPRLKLEVPAHEPCDSRASNLLDGVLAVRRLVTAFVDGSGENRGLHTGAFDWVGSDAQVRGTLSGTTNVGTHRQPAFDPCQECHAPGHMEGRLCDHIVKTRDDRLRGCRVTASYRLRFDAGQGAIDTAITGTIEGLIVCACDKQECVDLTGFPAMSHANPWAVGSLTFLVHDFGGAPAATADVVTLGGVHRAQRRLRDPHRTGVTRQRGPRRRTRR
jgi:hypothetical protein